jgi:hypothetical protein
MIFANAIVQIFPQSGQLSGGEYVVWGLCMFLAALFGGVMVIILARGLKPQWASLVFMGLSGLCFAGAVFLATMGNIREAHERRRLHQEERERSRLNEGQSD